MRFSDSNRPRQSPGSDFRWSTIENIIVTTGPLLDTTGDTLRWLLAQRLSSLLPPPCPFYNSNLILISINVYNGPTYQ